MVAQCWAGLGRGGVRTDAEEVFPADKIKENAWNRFVRVEHLHWIHFYTCLNKISVVQWGKMQKLSILTFQIYPCNTYFQPGVSVDEVPWEDSLGPVYAKHQPDLEWPYLELLRDIVYHCQSSQVMLTRRNPLCMQFSPVVWQFQNIILQK